MTRSTTIEIAPRSAAVDLTDAALLGRFLARRDEAAFEELVRRHGPGVLRTCRHRMVDEQDAEDACQATFLVLIRRADAIRQVDDVGAWLRGVARRIAVRAKARADRDRIRKGAAVDVGEVAGPEDDGLDDLRPAIRAEVERLPEKFRRPVELCYWEGLSNDQAAERLECPSGTVKWRLSRARELLRDRFARRGIALAAPLLSRRSNAIGAATPAEVGPRHAPRQGNDVEGSVLPDGFVRETVAMAVLVRDIPPSFLTDGARGKAVRRGRRRGRTLQLAPMIAILATMALSLSAFGWSRPTGPGMRVARFLAEARAAAIPGGRNHHCQAEARERLHPRPSSVDPKGPTP